MAYCLGMPMGARWIDLPHGVKVHVKPINTAIYQMAEAAAAREIAKLFDAKGNIEEHGGLIEGLPDLTTQEGRQGYANFIFTRALGRTAIFEWDGMYLADKVTPAPVGEAAIDELLTAPDMAEAFVGQYTAPFKARLFEKKDSMNSADGSSRADASTAPSA
jgi:hypothetical protein